MLVKELIEKLREAPPNGEVYYAQDAHREILFDLAHITERGDVALIKKV